MIAFPNCKINLGLNILDSRDDGYHNLESIFIPVLWCDVLEIIESEKDELIVFGKTIEADQEKNSCFKALKLLRRVRTFPPVKIFLLKNIPMGAGLGGGSSDAAFTLTLLNQKFELGFSNEELILIAINIGSDCAFFINNKPMFVTGKGEINKPVVITFPDMLIAICYPNLHVDTSYAYQLLKDSRTIKKSKFNHIELEKLQNSNIVEWKDFLQNDFEEFIFKQYPEIEKLKNFFYSNGADFSLMSGSGSSVFAIFKNSVNSDWKRMLENSSELFIWHISDLNVEE